MTYEQIKQSQKNKLFVKFVKSNVEEKFAEKCILLISDVSWITDQKIFFFLYFMQKRIRRWAMNSFAQTINPSAEDEEQRQL